MQQALPEWNVEAFVGVRRELLGGSTTATAYHTTQTLDRLCSYNAPMPYDRPAPAPAKIRFSRPEVHGLPLVVMVLIAPTRKHAMQQRTAAAMTAARVSVVHAKGMTEGREPRMK
jgi:hypothetical protein